MTSKRPTECFVYITLPGAREAITAGKFVLSETPTGDPIGQFVYGRSYLANRDAVEIDPVELKLSDQTYDTVRLNGVFGAIRDAGQTTGDGESLKSTPGSPNSANSIIFWSRRTTGRGRWASERMSLRRPRAASSTRLSISRVCRRPPRR